MIEIKAITPEEVSICILNLSRLYNLNKNPPGKKKKEKGYASGASYILYPPSEKAKPSPPGE